MAQIRRYISASLLIAGLLVVSLSLSPHAVKAASTLTVTTTADTAPPCRASAFSLRCAITQANTDGSGDTITFKIPSTDRGCQSRTIQGHTVSVCTISPTSNFDTGLPQLTANNTTIDGYTQAGAAPNTNPVGVADNAVLTIVLDGTQTGFNGSGLVITGTGDTVKGLCVTDFQEIAVDFEGSGGTLTGNFIGLAPDGTTAKGNLIAMIARVGGVTVGGTTPAAANVVGGNISDGLEIFGFTGSTSLVQGNLIGTNAAGTVALGNGGFAGVDLAGATHVTVGGTVTAARNLISGNNRGVFLSQGASADTIEGNYIGVNIAGTAALHNTTGIDVDASSNNIIGGTVSGARNIISGNVLEGVFITESTANVVEGNYIGTDSTGTVAVGNGQIGVALMGENADNNNIIGGTAAGAGNVISGNTSHGIAIVPEIGRTDSNNSVIGNFIGVDASGTRALGNTDDGIFLGNGTLNNSITRNVIANNTHSGILLGASNTNTNIHNPLSQNSLFANGGLGIDLSPQGTVNCTTMPPGPNDYTPCPLITSASTTQISGTAPANATVEVFIATNEANDQGHGEGKTFLGSATASASGTWSLVLAAGRVAHGQFVTATTTTPGSAPETSEFSANLVVQ